MPRPGSENTICFGSGAPRKLPAEKTLTPGHLQIGGKDAARIPRVLAGEMGGEHARLLVSRLDQPVAGAAMLGALADRIDAGRAGLQMVVDENAAIDGEIGGAREIDVRPDPGRNHDEIGFDLLVHP